MKKLLFVNVKTNSSMNTTLWFPLGILYLATIAERAGYAVQVIDQRIEEVKEKDIYQAAALLLSVTTPALPYAMHLSRRAIYQGIPVIVGGAHPTAVHPDEILQWANCVVQGHAFDSILDILADLSAGRLQGVYKREVVTRGTLQKLPIPNYSLLKNRASYLFSIFSSLGCSNHCTFCMVPQLGNCLRRPTKSCIRELTSQEVASFTLVDDNFIGDDPRGALELLQAMREVNRPLRFFGNVDINILLYPEVLRAFIDAGGRSVFIGLESLRPENLRFLGKFHILRRVVNREPNSAAEVVAVYCRVIRALQSYGITVYGGFMYGLPYDTKDDIQDIIQFAQEVLDVAYLSIFTPFPSTPLFRRFCQQKLLILPCRYEHFDTHHLVYCHPRITAADIYQAVLEFYEQLASPEVVLSKTTSLKQRGLEASSEEVASTLRHNYDRAKSIYAPLFTECGK